jgi:hypothetical protein
MRTIKWLVAVSGISALVLLGGALERDTATAAPGYPPAGTEQHAVELCFSDLLLDIDLDGTPESSAGAVCFSGGTIIDRSDPYDSGGFQTIDTEIVSMSLVGFVLVEDFTVTAGVNQGLPQSLGQIQEQVAGNDFPADSFFNIFFETDTGSFFGVLESCGGSPTLMEAVVSVIPTYGATYTTVGNAPIPSCTAGGVERTRGLDPTITVAAPTGPPAVGGVVGLPVDGDAAGAPQDSGSSVSDAAVATAAAGIVAVLVAVAAGGWYARRRWLS